MADVDLMTIHRNREPGRRARSMTNRTRSSCRFLRRAVTWRHLAKNLGMPVAKADRRLVRLAAAAGRDCVDVLCEEISAWLGEPVAVVDVVLWQRPTNRRWF